MNPKMKPLQNWVVLRMDAIPDRTAGGIALPPPSNRPSSTREVRSGLVLAVGPGAWQAGSFVRPEVRTGDRALVLVSYERAELALDHWVVPFDALVMSSDPPLVPSPESES